MNINIKTTDTAVDRVAALVYGAAGSGKTTLCGTAPSPFIISAEGGLLSLRNKAIPFTEVSNFQQVRDALAWCRADAAKHGIQTVCLDSISEIAEVCLADEKKKTKDPRQAYGELAVQVINIVKEFRDLNQFNVLVTCKATVATDPITGVAKAMPQSPGQQVGPALPYLFDLVMHSFMGKDPEGRDYHALQTHATQSADAKDRSGVLDAVEYPDFTYLVNKILTPKS